LYFGMKRSEIQYNKELVTVHSVTSNTLRDAQKHLAE